MKTNPLFKIRQEVSFRKNGTILMGTINDIDVYRVEGIQIYRYCVNHKKDKGLSFVSEKELLKLNKVPLENLIDLSTFEFSFQTENNFPVVIMRNNLGEMALCQLNPFKETTLAEIALSEKDFENLIEKLYFRYAYVVE